EAESELIAAYNVEYSGIKFALFYAGEYAHTLAICGLAATVFLGGYLGPAFLPGPAWLVSKGLRLFALIPWIRWSLMRPRVDQALRLNWMILLPASLVNLLIAAWWVAGSWRAAPRNDRRRYAARDGLDLPQRPPLAQHRPLSAPQARDPEEL